jgi:hypothetical protein
LNHRGFNLREYGIERDAVTFADENAHEAARNLRRQDGITFGRDGDRSAQRTEVMKGDRGRWNAAHMNGRGFGFGRLRSWRTTAFASGRREREQGEHCDAS